MPKLSVLVSTWFAHIFSHSEACLFIYQTGRRGEVFDLFEALFTIFSFYGLYYFGQIQELCLALLQRFSLCFSFQIF